MISTNKTILNIHKYMRQMGWVTESVILQNIIIRIENTDKENILVDLINTADTCSIRTYFYNFKHLATSKKGKFNSLLLENAWMAFDSALLAVTSQPGNPATPR